MRYGIRLGKLASFWVPVLRGREIERYTVEYVSSIFLNRVVKLG